MLTEELVEFRRPLADVKVTKLPGSITLECEVSKSRLQPQWLKDDKPIRPSKKYDIVSDGCTHKLVIRDVDGMDEGDYKVMLKNSSSSANLSIQGER